jgi:hypothetical protein
MRFLQRNLQVKNHQPARNLRKIAIGWNSGLEASIALIDAWAGLLEAGKTRSSLGPCEREVKKNQKTFLSGRFP